MSTDTKGPSTTMKGQMPKSQLARWKTTNLSFATERPSYSARRSYKRHVQDWKALRQLMVKGTPYTRFPANLRGAIADLLVPLSRSESGFRRDARAESGEIVQVAS